MKTDNSNNHPFSANRKPAGGAAQGGDAAPVFVANCREFFVHLASLNPHAFRGMVDFRFFLMLLCPALVYALLFSLFGLSSSRFYQAWLDFCLPLTEFVGSLTPRAGRIAEELIAEGYPQRVDDAAHAIAMSRVMMFPFYVYWLTAIVAAYTDTPPSVVSCTRQMRMQIWFKAFGPLILSMLAFAAVEYVLGEDAKPDGWVVGQYHSGNSAIFLDIGFVWLILNFFILGIVHLLMMRAVRFNITN